MNPVIGIIGGKGQMGQLFASFFKEHNIKVLISDVNTKLKNQQLAQNSDITIISVPIDKTKQVIKDVLPDLKEGSAIMDFTSVKEMPIKAMLKGKNEVLGIHPMFGATNPVPGQRIIICPTKKSGKWSKWMQNFLKKNGSKLETMSPKQHDEMMSIVQAMIHFADIAFVEALKDTNLNIKEILKYSSSASELKILLSARLIAQDPGLYGNIQIENNYSIKTLKKYRKAVNKLLKIVKNKKKPAFEKYFLQNRKFLGSFNQTALKDSSYLIDKYIEKKESQPRGTKKSKPTKQHIAVLGPENTFTDLAASKYLRESDQKLSKYFATSIDKIFELVEKGTVSEGIIPIENKLHGTVRESLDGLFFNNVHISKEVEIPIHHSLITLKHTKKENINKIISHPQAIGQCKKYLKKHFPKAELAGVSSTANAVNELLKNNQLTTAAIALDVTANNPKLKVLAKNIEDDINSTKFIIIRKGTAKQTKSTKAPQAPQAPQGSSQMGKGSSQMGKGASPGKTSIAFYFDADSPGSLHNILGDFAKNKINLSKIESRPTKASFGQYIFYIDFEANSNNPKAKKLLQTIKQKVAKLKILGSY